MFTGLFGSKRAGEYPYMLLDGESGEESVVRLGKPPAELIRHEVAFEDLPAGARRSVLEAYREMWEIEE